MNRRTLIVMITMLALFFGWQYLIVKIYTRMGWELPWEKKPAATQPVATPTTASTVATTRGAPATQAASPATAPTTPVARGSLRLVGGAGSAVLGSPQKEDPQYRLGLHLTARGAGVESVTLNHYFQSIERKALYRFQVPYPEESPLALPLAARAVVVDDVELDLAGSAVSWELVSPAQPGTATYKITVVDPADMPVLEIHKIWQLRPTAPDQKRGLGYLLTVRYEVHNRGGIERRVRLKFTGPTAPPAENANDTPSVIVGYDNDRVVVMEHTAVASLASDKEKPSTEMKNKHGYPMLWAGMTSAYFDAIIRPDLEGVKLAMPVESLRAVALNPGEKLHPHVALEFATKETRLSADATAALPLELFLGPKLRSVLNSAPFDQYPRAYDTTLVLTSGPCGWCTFSWLIGVLVWMLNGFHFIFRDWGLAIIALVVVVRLALHPITKRSQISMQKMGKMGPEMERIKKKYTDQPDELRKAQAELIRQQGITPILGCLPMFLQMPIWIALWQSLQTSFELRQAPFLWGLTWIRDLSQPDHLLRFSQPIAGFFCLPTIDGLNILPLLLAVVFWLQQKYTPKPPAMTPEQQQQQKMMQWMTLLFPLLLYSGPSGLNLYILTSTAIGIWEARRIRDHVKQQEEAERAGRVLVDAPASRSAKRLAKDEKDKPQTPPRSGLMGWLANLQRKAEEMRHETERRKKQQ
jgi:YidC/Oxa1 family membrane protein insertase